MFGYDDNANDGGELIGWGSGEVLRRKEEDDDDDDDARCDNCQAWSSKYNKLHSEHYRMLRHVDLASGSTAEFNKLHNDYLIARQDARAAKEQAAYLVWQMLKLREVVQQAIKYVPAVDKCWHNTAIRLLGDIEKYKEGSLK
jgi:hypothetical protein